MRIVHFSDLHLSTKFLDEYKDYFIKELIKDLLSFNSEKQIDLILITGDLLDKGGHDLLELKEYELVKNQFEIFEDLFITPISKSLSLSKKRFHFVPGNHDVDESEILLLEEKKLSKEISKKNINDYLKENEINYNNSEKYINNKRIKKFKEFEKEFHKDNESYIFGINQSTYIHECNDNKKIGLILLNDSWRYKSIKFEGDREKLLFGKHQIELSLRDIADKTNLNICLFHHSIDDFEEKEEISKLLSNSNIDIFLYGHYHKQNVSNVKTTIGQCEGFRCRASFNYPEEENSNYQPGYQIFDLDLNYYLIENVFFRKYINNSNRTGFDSDVDSAPQGKISSIKLKRHFKESDNKLERLNQQEFNQL